MLLSSGMGVRGTSNLRVLWPALGEGQRPSCPCHFSDSFTLKYSLCQTDRWGSVSSVPSPRTPSTVRMQGVQSLCSLARNQLNDTGAPALLPSSSAFTQQPERCFLRSFKLDHYPPSATMASYQAWQKFQSPHHDSPGPSWAWRLLDLSFPSSYCASALTDSACTLSVSDTLPILNPAFVKTGINLSEEVRYLGLWISQCLSPQGKGNHFCEVFVNSVKPTCIMLKYNSPSVWLQLIFFRSS